MNRWRQSVHIRLSSVVRTGHRLNLWNGLEQSESKIYGDGPDPELLFGQELTAFQAKRTIRKTTVVVEREIGHIIATYVPSATFALSARGV